MKHLEEQHQLDDWLATLGMALSQETLDLTLAHLRWVLETNANLNLTAAASSRDALRLHLLDSLSALPEVETAPTGVLIDIGTGGGFPGVPLAIASSRDAVLVDSVEKKAKAVGAFLELSGLGEQIATYAGRSETLALENPRFAAVAVARAVAEMPVVMELAAPLLQMGGLLVMLKGDPSAAEIESGQRAAPLLGYGGLSLRQLVLPGGSDRRTIVSARMTSSPSLRLPRRPGMAKKRPVA